METSNKSNTLVGMATFPAREPALIKTLLSLSSQNCEICVYLNEYEDFPSWVDRPEFSNVSFILGKDALGNIGDAGKFYKAATTKAQFLFFVDDDIEYPKDYIQTMTHWLNVFEGKAMVALHGRAFGDEKFPIVGYFKKLHPKSLFFHFVHPLSEPTHIHVAGTGTLAYDRTRLDFNIPYGSLLLKERNIADIHIAVECLKSNIPTFSIPRPPFWLKPIDLDPQDISIYDLTHQEDIPAKVLNKYMDNRPLNHINMYSLLSTKVSK